MAEYLEYAPPAALAPHLVCLWRQVVPAGARPYAHRVLPDGCVDIVCVGDGLPFVAGPATKPVIASLPAGSVVVGVRLRPGVAAAWLGAPAHALQNRDVALADLWDRRTVHALQDRMEAARSGAERLVALGDALARRLDRVGSPDPRVVEAIARLGRSPFGRVEAVARAVGLGERQLRRRFEFEVGYGPKALQSILRLQRMLLLARNLDASGRSLADLALAAGFADQAHLARESRRLTGLPARILARREGGTLAMSDLFKPGPISEG